MLSKDNLTLPRHPPLVQLLHILVVLPLPGPQLPLKLLPRLVDRLLLGRGLVHAGVARSGSDLMVLRQMGRGGRGSSLLDLKQQQPIYCVGGWR
jgi:hypothetical protein